jgi:pyruvate formate lyase activating enzyme
MLLNVHSIESFSTMDGPGIRYVIFLQGCSFRCRFCHNPDTWDKSAKREIDTEEILWEIRKNIQYLKPNRGGVTASGGEPLEQAEGLAGLFASARQAGITTCIDTAGYLLNPRVKSLLSITDIVLLDIKQADPQAHKEMTGHGNAEIFHFQDYLDETGIHYWVRYPLIEGLNDDEHSLAELKKRLAGRPCLEKIEVLPYHTLGVYKWKELGKTYTLEGKKAVTQERANEIARFLNLNNPLKGSVH